MDTKIQELTDKLFKEGVEKGQNEAQKIITNAQHEKEEILKKAKEEAEVIIANATKKAKEMQKNTESELRMYAAQAVSTLKTEVANFINDKIVSDTVTEAFEEKGFMKNLIVTLVSRWSKNERLIIEVEEAAALKQFMEIRLKELLSTNIEIKQVAGKPTSFCIVLEENNYKVNFGEKEFIDFFKTFLRPQLIDILF